MRVKGKSNRLQRVKRSMRKDKRKWVDDLASEAEQAAGNCMRLQGRLVMTKAEQVVQ